MVLPEFIYGVVLNLLLSFQRCYFVMCGFEHCERPSTRLTAHAIYSRDM